jgi:hypothetical protein
MVLCMVLRQIAHKLDIFDLKGGYGMRWYFRLLTQRPIYIVQCDAPVAARARFSYRF